MELMPYRAIVFPPYKYIPAHAIKYGFADSISRLISLRHRAKLPKYIADAAPVCARVFFSAVNWVSMF